MSKQHKEQKQGTSDKEYQIENKEHQQEVNLLREILDTEKGTSTQGELQNFEVYSPLQNFEQF